MRLGRIPWINCYPVYGAIDRGLVEMPAELVSGTASELNDLLAAGELQVSVVSAVEYARNAAAYHLLPDLAITCDGPVHSVALFSKRPARSWTATRCSSPPRRARRSSCSTSSSATGGACTRASRRRERRPPTWSRWPDCRTRRCSSSVTRRSCWRRERRYPVRLDLGAEWRAWTGLPFVFAVWAARREADLPAVQAIHERLIESRAWGLANLDVLSASAALATGVSEPVCRAYLGDLDYALSYRHLAGLTDFFRRLAHDGLVPDGSLSFIAAA